MSKAIKGIRAAFKDAEHSFERQRLVEDPLPQVERGGHKPGQWPGGPVSRLPPECPVVALGKDGKTCYFVDTLGQLTPVAVSEWSKKMLVDLFALTPNYPYWAWPRFNAKTLAINGMEVDEACACLVNACARRGLFNPVDRVRGRGGWTDRHRRFIWHSGDMLWTSERGRLKAAEPGEVDGIFYPRRPAIVEPWQEQIDHEDSPAPALLDDFKTWTWERPELDPLFLLGWLVCALAGGALEWRPTLFATGDRGVGKSTLQQVVRGILDDALHATADTTAAGIYQRVAQDCLPVAVDELEADADNRKVMAVVKLARLAASGAMMFRGGQDHSGVEFRAMNCFFFASINMPPVGPQDRSRMAILNLGRLDKSKVAGREPRVSDATGRMLLRQVMDAWPLFPDLLTRWKTTLWQAGFDGRAQETYGTLLAAAELVLGPAIEDAGLPVNDEKALGQLIREQTAGERAEQKDNWRGCLEHLLGSTIEAWRGGEKPTIGGTLEDLEKGALRAAQARDRLAAAGVGLVDKGKHTDGYGLAVPGSSPALARIFAGQVWGDGVWFSALKQGPAEVVRRFTDNRAVVKINRVATRCVIVDLAAYDRFCEEEG